MSESPSALRRKLLRWYDRAARSLPWRGVRDPYAIWVSEIMLQQTRVDTVVRYYERFMARFPTARALADASEDQVMSAWSGLGYYRRARLLHAGAREVVQRHGGLVPADPAARRGLPGVGRYTAGAIGSIAFDLPEPIVDGNVTRVLCRLYGIDSVPGRAVTEQRLWAEAGALVKGKRPGALNQALMELGATLCTKAAPDCDRCPVGADCHARTHGLQGRLPRARPRPAPKPVRLVAVAATLGRRGSDREVWLVRSEGPLFGGLWNLPMVEGQGRATARALLREHGIDARLGARPVARMEHVLTHRHLHVQLWTASAARASRARARRPFTLDRLETLGVSRLTDKALAFV